VQPDQLRRFSAYLALNHPELYKVFGNGGLIITENKDNDFVLGILLGEEYYTEEEKKELFGLANKFITGEIG